MFNPLGNFCALVPPREGAGDLIDDGPFTTSGAGVAGRGGVAFIDAQGDEGLNIAFETFFCNSGDPWTLDGDPLPHE